MSQTFEQVAHNNLKIIQLGNNKGCNFSRNSGLDFIIKNLEEGFVIILDDDDYFYPDALEKIRGEIVKNPRALWLTFNCCFEDGSVASKNKKYGGNSYIDDYMFGKK